MIELRASVGNQKARTSQRFVPLLNFQHRVVEVIITTRSPTVSSSGRPLLRFELPPGLNHPRMPKELLCGDSQVGILLKTMIKEVLHDW